MKSSKRQLKRKGSLTVEAALLLPLLLLLFSGIIEFGRILMVQQVITNAAREGARVAAINLDNTKALSAANTIATDYLVRSGINTSLASVSPTLLTVNGSEAVQVAINYNYTSHVIGFIPAGGNALNLHARVVMRREA